MQSKTEAFNSYLNQMYEVLFNTLKQDCYISELHEQASTLEERYLEGEQKDSDLFEELQAVRITEYEHRAFAAYQNGYADCICLLKRLHIL